MNRRMLVKRGARLTAGLRLTPESSRRGTCITPVRNATAARVAPPHRRAASLRLELTWTVVIAGSLLANNVRADNAEISSKETGPPRVLVLPYQPIYRSVPYNKATKATKFLLSELGKGDALQVVRGGVATEQSGQPDADPIPAAVAAAERSEARKDITRALTDRQTVITQMERHASQLRDAAEYVRAHHYLARAQMWAGEDEKAQETLKTAVRMNPGLPLPATQFSRMYRRWAMAATAQVAQEQTGELVVKSALPGATVFLDGRETDIAPVALQRIAPGKHIVGAKVDGVPRYRTIVRVPAGSREEFRITFGGTVGGTAVGEVNDAISVNGLPPAAVGSAAKAGREVNAAYVVAGGISKDEDHFNVHTFVVDVERARVQTLEAIQFDLDLLTAEADVFAVARQVEGAVQGFSGNKAMVAQIERRIQRQNPVHKVDAQPDFKSGRSQLRNAARRPRGPRKVIRALGGGRIKIKDEKE